MLSKRRVDFSRGSDFTSILIGIQERYNFSHPQMMQIRQRLIAVYQTQVTVRTYNRNRRQWELISEAAARRTPDVVTLDRLAQAAKTMLEAGSTLDQVCALEPKVLLGAARP